jgi:hypothetical protein
LAPKHPWSVQLVLLLQALLVQVWQVAQERQSLQLVERHALLFQ